MTRHWRVLLISFCVLLAGCGQSVVDGPGNDSEQPSVTGKLRLPTAAKRIATAKSALEGYLILAQSEATGKIYRGVTDAEGEFEIDIPDSEDGNTFMITILGDDGRAIGPVLFGTAGEDGITGLTVDGEASLGTIELPIDPTQQPIEPGDDGNVDGKEDSDLTTRLNDDGAPLGLATKGKGQEAQADTEVDSSDKVDKDHDGLIDILDADDNGNGTVDDFDGDGNVGGPISDIRVNFFMNLKVGVEEAAPYYSGTEAERNAALADDYVITLEAMPEPFSTRVIKSIHGLETPGPAYLPTATVLTSGSSPDPTDTLWSSLDYAFNKQADRFDVFVTPKTVMSSGDTFTIEIEFEDGTSEQFSRMINYVFKNIPKLLQYGAAGSLTNFNINDPEINGSPTKPIPFDGSQDLTLVFNPPPDDTGIYIEDLDYDFQIFFYDNAGGFPINNIDYDATWPTKPAGMQNNSPNYLITKDHMPALVNDTYTVTIPKEYFPDSIVNTTGETVTVGTYKIDITAYCPSGNCAIMITFKKQ